MKRKERPRFTAEPDDVGVPGMMEPPAHVENKVRGSDNRFKQACSVGLDMQISASQGGSTIIEAIRSEIQVKQGTVFGSILISLSWVETQVCKETISFDCGTQLATSVEYTSCRCRRNRVAESHVEVSGIASVVVLTFSSSSSSSSFSRDCAKTAKTTAHLKTLSIL